MNMSMVSIIVVDFFKAERVVGNVLSAVGQIGDFQLEIIIIDNSCNNDNKNKLKKLEKLANVLLVFNASNTGYVKACNQGVELASGDTIFLVNPDIIWKSNSIITQVLNKFASDTSIGIIGTRQINDDGSTPNTVRHFPNILAQIARRTFLRKMPWLRSLVINYEIDNFNYAISCDVDWVQSSFMVIKRSLWELVDGLDTRFFLFMADPDICYKVWSNSYRVVYVSDIVVGADGKRCSDGGIGSLFSSYTVRLHLRDAFLYQCKYLLKNRSPTHVNNWK